MLVQSITDDVNNPYHFQIYFRSKKKGQTNAFSKSILIKDTVEISEEGMKLYLNSKNYKMKNNTNIKEPAHV